MLRSIAVPRPIRWATTWPALRRARPAWVNLFIPFAALIVLIVGLTGWLSLHNGQQAVTELLAHYEQEVVSHIERDLTHRLSIPHRLNRNNVAAVELGLLDFDNPDMLERYFWHELGQNPEVNYIYAGSSSGGIVGVGRNGKGQLRVYRTAGFTQGEYSLYRADKDGTRQERIDSEPNYDARDRPWYQPAAQSRQERWSRVYRYVGEPILGVAASKPVIGEANQLRGVMATDLELTQISASLRSILNAPDSPSSLLVILERSGNLVATSAQDDPFIQVAPSEEQQRRHARDSADPLTRQVYKTLMAQFGTLDSIEQAADLTMLHSGERQFIHVNPFNDNGLDWLITVVMPEQPFMARINRNTRCTIALCLLAVVAAVVLSMVLARRMSRPLWQLSEASRALAQGRFNQQMPTYGTQELNVLSRSFNRMVYRLKDLFSQLEERNTHLEQRVAERTAYLTQTNYQLKLLLRSVSHDLRNPLTGMLLVLNSVREQGVAAPSDEIKASTDEIRLSRQTLNTLISSGERQLRLVNSLLEDNYIDDALDQAAAPPDVAQVETSLLGGRRLTLAPGALQEIVEQVKQDVQPLLLRHQAVLTTAVPQGLPPILADADQLWRVIENLISNAIAHNAPGIRIMIAADVVTSARMGTAVCCKIIDDGAGVSLEKQQHLFEPYQQGSVDSPGLGLGLYICRRIIEAHGGTIGVASQPGAGATFWFIVPVACPSDP